jgi:hypothetical protein
MKGVECWEAHRGDGGIAMVPSLGTLIRERPSSETMASQNESCMSIGRSVTSPDKRAIPRVLHQLLFLKGQILFSLA